METKIVYNVDPVSRAFIGSQECYKTSIDPNTWHYTGIAMDEAPPAFGVHEIPVANAELTEWEIKPFYIGTKYWLPDGSEHEITELFIAPPADALMEKPLIQEPPQTVFTALEFLEEFSEDEQLAVAERTLTSAPIKLWYDKLLAAGYVDLNDPRIDAGLSALVTAGLITEARKAEILAID